MRSRATSAAGARRSAARRPGGAHAARTLTQTLICARTLPNPRTNPPEQVGVLASADGSVFEGQFAADAKHGFGVRIVRDSALVLEAWEQARFPSVKVSP